MRLKHTGKKAFVNCINHSMVAWIMFNGISNGKRTPNWLIDYPIRSLVNDIKPMIGTETTDGDDHFWKELENWLKGVDCSGERPDKRIQRLLAEAVEWLSIHTDFAEATPI